MDLEDYWSKERTFTAGELVEALVLLLPAAPVEHSQIFATSVVAALEDVQNNRSEDGATNP